MNPCDLSNSLDGAIPVAGKHNPEFPFKIFKLSSNLVMAYCAATTLTEADALFNTALEEAELRKSSIREIHQAELDPGFWNWVNWKWSNTPILVGYYRGEFDSLNLPPAPLPPKGWNGCCVMVGDAQEPIETISSPVRKAFAQARREALRKQGVTTMPRVRANQTTMKLLP